MPMHGDTAPTINVRNQDELRWWAKELHVSEDQLRGAISNVGSSSDAVAQFLKASQQKHEHREPPKASQEAQGGAGAFNAAAEPTRVRTHDTAELQGSPRPAAAASAVPADGRAMGGSLLQAALALSVFVGVLIIVRRVRS